jgi:hypothetical protein
VTNGPSERDHKRRITNSDIGQWGSIEKENEVRKRLTFLGYAMLAIGFIFVIVIVGVAYAKVQDGYDSLAAFSEARNVTLSYDEDGQLIDRGTVEGAENIMALLTEDWQYPVDTGDFDPNDPLVNTASEYMFQMATINFHVLNGTQQVTLAEDAEFNGQTIAAGTYDVDVDGRYWTGFDRQDPPEILLGVEGFTAWSVSSESAR